MGGNYEKSGYNQLIEVMNKLNTMEADQKRSRREIKSLTSEVDSLRKAGTQPGYKGQECNVLWGVIFKKTRKKPKISGAGTCEVF